MKKRVNEFEKLKDDNEQISNKLKADRIMLKAMEETLSDERKQLEDAKASIEIVTKDSAGKLNELQASMKRSR